MIRAVAKKSNALLAECIALFAAPVVKGMLRRLAGRSVCGSERYKTERCEDGALKLLGAIW